jgi:hypothetical protein
VPQIACNVCRNTSILVDFKLVSRDIRIRRLPNLHCHFVVLGEDDFEGGCPKSVTTGLRFLRLKTVYVCMPKVLR